MLAAEAQYCAMEAELQARLDNYEAEHDYNEYHYELDDIEHDPYVLISAITALMGREWTISEVGGILDMLFEKQYILTETVETETRYRMETRTGSYTYYDYELEDWVTEEYEYEVEVPYTYYICTVKLENFNLSHVPVYIMSQEQLSLYAMYMGTLGNRPDLFGSSSYVGRYYGSEYPKYEIPPEALEDEQFAAIIKEAEKYLGFPYVWGGSSPSTSFDCSGFVSYVYNNCGLGWSFGRLGAEGLRQICAYVSPANAKPGDLIFFQGTYDTTGASHVGIYVGNNTMLHCGDPIQYSDISYAVCAYFGIETGENSFGYIATWSKGKELPELKASLETINHTASGLITDIDRNYKALMKERGLDKEPESLAAEPVQEITVQEPEPVSAPDNGSVPDPAISVESMNAYGYTDSNMLPLTKERALELMERDVTVYMLHTDNTEAMAFDADEIRSFDGIFGVEASEWGTVKDRFVPQDYEKAFLDNPADSFAIYQLRDNDDTVQLHYMNSEYLEKKGLSIQKENYAAVYAGDLDRRGDTQDKLNELYETFNIRRPEDFRGHSLSVSDIVALKQNGVVSCHYVDSWGFKELPGFLKPENYLKNAEMAMEDDYGMIDGIINNGPRKTVAELEEQSKTGTPISLLELAQAVQREDAEKRRAQQPVRREKSGEKPSILAKLKTPSVADTKSVKSAPKRSAEREL